jgi:hypothetical protein
VTLPEAEQSFYCAAVAQLEPTLQPVFAERVAQILGAHPDPGCGDVNRAVRQALSELWRAPPVTEVRSPARWSRSSPRFERTSRRAF